MDNQYQISSSINGDAYPNWCAVTAYFDGDGSVTFEKPVERIEYTLSFMIRWADNYGPQLQQLGNFLDNQEIKYGIYHAKSKGNKELVVSNEESVLRVAKAMAESGCSFKKKVELCTVVEYLENRITGNEVVSRFNQHVKCGARSGEIHTTNVPFTKEEGFRRRIEKSIKRAQQANRRFTDEDVRTMKESHFVFGASQTELARKYGVTPQTIHDIIREKTYRETRN